MRFIMTVACTGVNMIDETAIRTMDVKLSLVRNNIGRFGFWEIDSTTSAILIMNFEKMVVVLRARVLCTSTITTVNFNRVTINEIVFWRGHLLCCKFKRGCFLFFLFLHFDGQSLIFPELVFFSFVLLFAFLRLQQLFCQLLSLREPGASRRLDPVLRYVSLQRLSGIHFVEGVGQAVRHRTLFVWQLVESCDNQFVLDPGVSMRAWSQKGRLGQCRG